jgi:hypothetical protein
MDINPAAFFVGRGETVFGELSGVEGAQGDSTSNPKFKFLIPKQCSNFRNYKFKTFF